MVCSLLGSAVHQESTKREVNVLERLEYNGRLGASTRQEEADGAGVVQPGAEKVWEDLINVCEYLMGVEVKEDGNRLFSVLSREWIRANTHKLKFSKFHLNIRKTPFL